MDKEFQDRMSQHMAEFKAAMERAREIDRAAGIWSEKK